MAHAGPSGIRHGCKLGSCASQSEAGLFTSQLKSKIRVPKVNGFWGFFLVFELLLLCVLAGSGTRAPQCVCKGQRTTWKNCFLFPSCCSRVSCFCHCVVHSRWPISFRLIVLSPPLTSFEIVNASCCICSCGFGGSNLRYWVLGKHFTH